MSAHSAQKGHSSFRWTTGLPEEETNPIGPDDCLRRAVEKLGPFKHRLQAEANRLGPWEGLGGRIALSEQLALERVWLLATTYNRQVRLDEGAPRSKDVVNALDKVETLAGELARHLLSLDDMTRHCLQTAGTGISSLSDLFQYPLMEAAADVAGLPTPAGWNAPGTEFRWVQRLETLSQYANFTRTTLLLSKGIDDVDVPDRGGNTNLYKDLYGSARWKLVHEGWQVHELFKPGHSTGTEGGPFHLFLLDVFEFATGLDPDNHSKLTYWLKRVSKVNRRNQQLMDRKLALMEEQFAIDASGSSLSLEDRRKRSAEIAKKLIAVERERYELWPELYPYSYREKEGGQ